MQSTAEKIRLIVVLAVLAMGTYAGVHVYHFAQSIAAHAPTIQ